MIGKQEISYWETQQTATNSDTLWNPVNFLAIVRQVNDCYLLLYESKDVYVDKIEVIAGFLSLSRLLYPVAEITYQNINAYIEDM